MMKRVIPLLFAGAATATRLGISNVGVEEIGDQIEFFPEEFPSREELLQRARLLEEATLTGVNDEKPSPVQSTRRDQSITCGSNEAKVAIIASGETDGITYVIKDDSNRAVFNGSGMSKTCLSAGKYTLRIKDAGKDGMGSNGKLLVKVNGGVIMNVDTSSSFSVVDKSFSVTLFSGRNSGGDSPTGEVFSGDSGFVKKNCYQTDVYLKIDKYGKETSFSIKSQDTGREIFSKTKPLAAWNEDTFNAGCLEPGDYTITFTDIDGICCKNGEGEFKLIIDGVELFSGGRFIGSISHDFKVGFDWGEGMASRDWEYLLAHNERRQDYHTRCNQRYCGKKYRPLKWSSGLARDAAKYAEELLDTCDDTGIKHEPGIEQGENLAKNKGFGDWGRLYPADKIVKRFVDNEAKWSWTKNAHLTQALWYATRYLGCAESTKVMENGATCRMQVCRYAKAGNCEMGKYDSHDWPNHEIPMMMDDSSCGPVCPPEGCYI